MTWGRTESAGRARAISGNDGRSTLPPDSSAGEDADEIEGDVGWRLQRCVRQSVISRLARQSAGPFGAALPTKSAAEAPDLECRTRLNRRQAGRAPGCWSAEAPARRLAVRRAAGESLLHLAVAGALGVAARRCSAPPPGARTPPRRDCADIRRFPNRRRSGRISGSPHRGRCPTRRCCLRTKNSDMR